MWEFSLIIGALILVLYRQLFVRYIKGWVNIEEAEYQQKAALPSCSIIIAFRNEEESLPSLFMSIDNLNLDHIDWQLFLVDDHSGDTSYQLCIGWQNSRQNIQVLKNIGEGKKSALETAILQAQNEILICTDADVRFESNWVKSILNSYESETQMISGPVQLIGNNSFFHNWQELEFLGLIGIGAASIKEHRPNMCNGANISFRKSAFSKVDGYRDNQHLLSGDDEFLMHKISKYYGNGAVKFCKTKESIVYTDTKNSLKEFLSQRMRWSSKATHYKDKRIFSDLLIAYLTSALGVLFIILAFFNLSYLYIAIGFIGIKALLEFRFYKKILPFFNKSSLLRGFILSELIQVVYVTVIGVLGTFVKFEWKGRKQ